jgi:hypothetical protein
VGPAALLPSRLPRNSTWSWRRIKRLKDLERENATLKRFLADVELEKVALTEIANGNILARSAGGQP